MGQVESTGYAANVNLMGVTFVIPCNDFELQPFLLPMPLPDTASAKQALAQVEQLSQDIKQGVQNLLQEKTDASVGWEQWFIVREWTPVWVVDFDAHHVVLQRMELMWPGEKKALTIFSNMEDRAFTYEVGQLHML